MPTILPLLFLKAKRRGDTLTSDMFAAPLPGTYERSITRKDGVVQTYHVKPEEAPKPKPVAAPAMPVAPPKPQPVTDQDLAAAWNNMGEKRRLDALRYDANLQTRDGRPTALARKLATTPDWAAMPDAIKDRVMMEARVWAYSARKAQQARADAKPLPFTPKPPDTPPLEAAAIEQQVAGVDLRLLRTKLPFPYWRVQVVATGKVYNAGVFPGDTKAQVWDQVARSAQAAGDRFAKDLLDVDERSQDEHGNYLIARPAQQPPTPQPQPTPANHRTMIPRSFLGREVLFALPRGSSTFKPSREELRIAADKLGISVSEAEKSLAAYTDPASVVDPGKMVPRPSGLTILTEGDRERQASSQRTAQIDDHEDLADEMLRDPHSAKAKELIARIAGNKPGTPDTAEAQPVALPAYVKTHLDALLAPLVQGAKGLAIARKTQARDGGRYAGEYADAHESDWNQRKQVIAGQLASIPDADKRAAAQAYLDANLPDLSLTDAERDWMRTTPAEGSTGTPNTAEAAPAPREGERNAEGLVFHDGRWHREEDKPAEYRYALVNRPAGIGAVPKDGMVRVEPRPKEGQDHYDRARHGFIIYSRELTPEEQAGFELASVVDGAERTALAGQVAMAIPDDYVGPYIEEAIEDPNYWRQAVAGRLQELYGRRQVSVGDFDAFAAQALEKLKARQAATEAKDKAPEPAPELHVEPPATEAEAMAAIDRAKQEREASPAPAAPEPQPEAKPPAPSLAEQKSVAPFEAEYRVFGTLQVKPTNPVNLPKHHTLVDVGFYRRQVKLSKADQARWNLSPTADYFRYGVAQNEEGKNYAWAEYPSDYSMMGQSLRLTFTRLSDDHLTDVRELRGLHQAMQAMWEKHKNKEAPLFKALPRVIACRPAAGVRL